MFQSQQIFQDRYQLQKLLGQNAGRETWLAVDQQTRSQVVMKFLTFSDRVQWDQVRLFEREAQTLKHLTHPQVPQYQDFFCVDDRLFWFALVQSYIPGDSLKQLLEQGKVFSEAKVRRIAKQILKILIYLHGLSPPVLHRDIKPSNLIWAEDDKVYLVDFGTVQDRVAKAGATFTVVGTYGYAPLEQLGGRATPASDLYALGATLIHLLTGVAPANLPQVHGRLQFTAGLKINPGFVRWLWRLTEVNAELRFATARIALQVLLEHETAITEMLLDSTQDQALRKLQNSGSHRANNVQSWSDDFQSWEALQGSGCHITLHRTPQQLEFSINHKPFNVRGFATLGRFDSQHFELCWRWFGLTRRKQGFITDIDQVSEGELQGGKRFFPAVKITVGVDEYLITSIQPPLTEAERDWLLQKIRQWLGL